MIGLAPLEIEIHPGEHPEGHLFGMTFNLDTIWVTVVAGAIVLALGFWARAQLTKDTEDHVPTKLQLVWETVVNEVNTQVEGNLGKVNPFVVPLAVALFFFILIANWIEVIPTELNANVHLLPSRRALPCHRASLRSSTRAARRGPGDGQRQRPEVLDAHHTVAR